MRSPAHMANTSNNSLASSQGLRNSSQPHQSAGSSRATCCPTPPKSGGSVSSLPPPSHFVVHRVDATHVKLSWQPMDKATHYVVHNLTTGGSTGRVETCAVMSGLEAGREYSFSVSCADRFGQSKPSRPQKVLMPDDVEGSRGVRKTLRRKLNSSESHVSEMEHELRKSEAKISNLERRIEELYMDNKEKLHEKDLEIERLKARLGEGPAQARSFGESSLGLEVSVKVKAPSCEVKVKAPSVECEVSMSVDIG